MFKPRSSLMKTARQGAQSTPGLAANTYFRRWRRVYHDGSATQRENAEMKRVWSIYSAEQNRRLSWTFGIAILRKTRHLVSPMTSEATVSTALAVQMARR
jgi:hypothetical protein